MQLLFSVNAKQLLLLLTCVWCSLLDRMIEIYSNMTYQQIHILLIYSSISSRLKNHTHHSSLAPAPHAAHTVFGLASQVFLTSASVVLLVSDKAALWERVLPFWRRAMGLPLHAESHLVLLYIDIACICNKACFSSETNSSPHPPLNAVAPSVNQSAKRSPHLHRSLTVRSQPTPAAGSMLTRAANQASNRICFQLFSSLESF